MEGVREWLQHQACVNQVEYDETTQRFLLGPEAEAVLVDEDHPAYLMGAYHSALSVFPAAEKLEEAFRTGLGMTYDDHGANCACGMEKMGAFTKKHRLVQEILPLVPNLVDRLEEGIKVADVGCGGDVQGASLEEGGRAVVSVRIRLASGLVYGKMDR